MIWTEEQNESRQMDNMLDRKGKTCANCYWGNASKGDEFVTCGRHHQNFTVSSFCDYWTSSKDPYLVNYRKKRLKEIKQKHNLP